jgi:hypothetical protein
MPTNDGARIDVGREAREREGVGDELHREEQAHPADVTGER